MARYSFLTTWVLDAPVEAVFDALHDYRRWPEWWQGVQSTVELEPGDDGGVGAVVAHSWRSYLPYTLHFHVRAVRIERPWLLEGEASGELAGSGRWRIFGSAGGATCVTYEWEVRTTRWWMNLIAPVARPLFRWNHDYVMRAGGEGLARLLGAELLICR